MSKTLGSVLLIAAAIAVNVVPGVGQVISGAIYGGLAGGAVGSAAAAAFALGQFVSGALTLGLTVAGLQAFGGLLGLGPSVPKPDTTETPLKTPRPPRVSAYGRSRLYGAYVLFETAPDGTAVDVYAVHDGEADAIETHYLNDEVVVVTGGTVAAGTDGRYGGGAVNFYTTDGSAPGAGFPAVTSLVGGSVWSAAHRGDGVVAMAVTCKAVKSKSFQEVYPSSSVPLPSIVARWQKCPDPDAVDPLDESGWTWTENPVRQLLHYKLTVEGPQPELPRSDAGYAAALAALRAAWWARHIAPTLAYWQTAAADCDAARSLKAGGSEPRYRSAVAHKHTDKHQGPVAALLATFDGWMVPRADGALVLYSGKYIAPTVDIGPGEIVSYTHEKGPPDEADAVNEIIVAYISAAHDYNTVETDPWRDETDISRRGRVLSTALDLQIPSHAQGRYLAKRLMQRKNAQNRGTVTTNIAGRAMFGHRFINLRLEEAGTVFYDGPVEVLAARRVLRGGVTFEWVAADPNVDNWNPASEEGDPAPVGNRIAPTPLDAPVIDEITGVAQGDDLFASLEITGPDRDDLQWYVRQRAVGASVWGPEIEYGDTAEGAEITLLAGPVPAGANLEFQAAYRIGDGRFSPWSAAVAITLDEVVYDGGVEPEPGP